MKESSLISRFGRGLFYPLARISAPEAGGEPVQRGYAKLRGRAAEALALAVGRFAAQCRAALRDTFGFLPPPRLVRPCALEAALSHAEQPATHLPSY